MIRLGSLLLLTAAIPAQDPPAPIGGFATRFDPDVAITFSDGYRTLLDVRYPTVAAPATGWPCVVLVHGSGGNRRTPYVRDSAERLARRGFCTLAYDTGNQGVTAMLNPPGTRDDELRMRDLAEIVHLAEQAYGPRLDDRRLAVFGHSAGGHHALWAAAYSGDLLPQSGFVTEMPPIAAVHADAQVLDHRQDKLPGGHMIRSSWATARFRSQGPAGTVPALVLQKDYAGLAALLQNSSTENLLPRLQQSSVPLLLTYGFDDSKHFVRSTTDAIPSLPATLPFRYVQTTGGHGSAANDGADLLRTDLMDRWFDRFLKGIPNLVDLEPMAEIGVLPADAAAYVDPTTAWQHRRTDSWPLPPTQTLYLRGAGGLSARAPSGPEPVPPILHRVTSGYDMAAFLQSGGAPGAVLPDIPLVARAFDSAPLSEPRELLGRASFEADVRVSRGVDCQLQAALFDVPASGPPRFITCGVAALRQIAAGRHRFRVELDDVGYVVRTGHRLRLSIENINLYRQPGHTRFGVIPDFDDVDLTVLIDSVLPPRLALPIGPAQPSLVPRIATTSAAGGWSHALAIEGESSRAGQVYAVLTGVSGTAPGTAILGANLPINFDVFTSVFLDHAGPPYLAGFTGLLDGSGRGAATVSIPASLAPAALGLRFAFAAVIFDSSFRIESSGPVSLRLAP